MVVASLAVVPVMSSSVWMTWMALGEDLQPRWRPLWRRPAPIWWTTSSRWSSMRSAASRKPSLRWPRPSFRPAPSCCRISHPGLPQASRIFCRRRCPPSSPSPKSCGRISVILSRQASTHPQPCKRLVEGLPELFAYIPDIVINIAGLINDNAPKILAGAVGLMVQLGKGLIDSIPLIIQNMGKIVEAIVSVISAFNWMNLGASILKGWPAASKAWRRL